MFKIEFNAAFRTDKAGRAANQDNGFYILDLQAGAEAGVNNINTDRTVGMGAKGALFVVADGMGGMNAGEKASELIVKGMQKAFANMPANVPGDVNLMSSYLEHAISAADADVKAFAYENPHTRGMGSTIVALWLYGDKAIASWVGDSRIYRYNPDNGLVRLSHDHSYVQGLVDTGRLPEHMAFDHPDSNIITRSLGDNNEKANPETRIYNIYDRDEFLLCSDGLCGLLTDDEIAAAMKAHEGSSKATLDALWQEGDRKGWSDNATIEVVCVTGELPAATVDKTDGYPNPNSAQHSRVTTPASRATMKVDEQPIAQTPQTSQGPQVPNRIPTGRKGLPLYIYIILAAVLVCAGAGVYFFVSKDKETKAEDVTLNMEEEQELDDRYDSEIKELNGKRNMLEELKGSVKGNVAISDDIKGKLTRGAFELVSACEQLLDERGLSDEQRETVNELLNYGKRTQYFVRESEIHIQRNQSNTQVPGQTSSRPATSNPQRQTTESVNNSEGSSTHTQPNDEQRGSTPTRDHKPNPNKPNDL